MAPKSIPPLLLGLLALGALFAPAPAVAAVGVEKTSRHGGSPGDTVTLTLGCGFCYPPCKGAPGHRHPSPCMLGTKAPPPVSFPISLVPIEQAPSPFRCGPNALCAPAVSAPPHRAPFRYLGEAIPPSKSAESESDRAPVPRYVLDFKIPNLRPGVYAYVIYCDVCKGGKGGSLIASPQTRPWRLQVRPPSDKATIDR